MADPDLVKIVLQVRIVLPPAPSVTEEARKAIQAIARETLEDFRQKRPGEQILTPHLARSYPAKAHSR